MSHAHLKIAVFDSGVGGLSIYQQIKRSLPDAQYVFVSDNQAYPYGTKNEQELIERVLLVVGRIIERYQPDILVVACNSASTVALPHLRTQFNLPIVGVVPAIKPAAELSKNKVIGLLATPATVKRAYTEQLIEEFAPDCQVHRVGSSELVDLSEQKLHTGLVDQQVLEQCLMPLFTHQNMDILVLACTHFPLLNNEIEKQFKLKNHPIELIDSGQAIANRVEQLSESIPLPIESTVNSSSKAVFTKEVTLSDYFQAYLKQQDLTQTEILEVIEQ